MILRELFVHLGANTDKATVDAFSQSLDDAKAKAGDVVKVLSGLTAMASGAAFGLWKLTRQTSEAANEALDGASRYGVSVETFQELSYAADMTGASMSDVGRALRRISRYSVNSTDKFSSLGISVRDANGELRSAESIFEDVADAIQAMPDGEQSAVAQDLFGRSGPALLDMFSQGAEGIARLREEAQDGIISTEAAEQFGEFDDTLARLRRTLSGFRNQLVAGVFPTINSLVTRLQGWLKTNREIINSKIEEWTERLIKLWKVAEREAGRLNKTVEQFGGWEKLFKALGAAIAGVGILKFTKSVGLLGVALKVLAVKGLALVTKGGLVAAIALAKPIAIGLAIIAVVAGIALVVEDLITFLRGGESFIGDFLERFGAAEQLKGVFASVAAAFQQLGRVVMLWARLMIRAWALQFKLIWAIASPVLKLLVTAIVGFWKNVTWPVIQQLAAAFAWAFGKVADGLQWVEDNWEHFGEAIKRMATDAAQWFRDQWESVIGWLTGMLDRVLERFEKVRDSVSKLPGAGAVGGLINRARGAFAPSESRNPRSPAGNNTQNASTQVNVHVDGSNSDPADIGREVARGAEDGMGRALRQTQAATAGGEM